MASLDINLKLDQFKYQEIGKSQNTFVYKLYKKDESQPQFALKTVPHSPQSQHQCLDECLDLQNEFQILKNIDHPNIIKVFESKQKTELLSNYNEIEGHKGCYMTLELANYDLVELINSQNIKKIQMDLRFLQNLFQQILQSVRYLHSKNIVHNDLKADNFLVFKEDLENKKFHLKLADFGHAQELNLEKIQSKSVSFLQQVYQKFKDKNKNHLSPELTSFIEQCQCNDLFQNDDQNNNNKISDIQLELSKSILEFVDLKKCDIFALGVSLFYSVLWKYPFRYGASENDKIYKHLYNKNFDAFWANFTKILIRIQKTSPQKQVQNFQNIVFQMLNPNFKERPNIQEVLQHPFFIDM